MTLNLKSVYQNRTKNNHGFSGCEICKSKLMAYLEEGHTFEDVMIKLKEIHPNIKNIRAYTQNAIRQTTGLGMYDNYIIKHNLWTVRNPILYPETKHLEEIWDYYAKKGKELIEMDKELQKALKPDDKVSKLLEYALKR